MRSAFLDFNYWRSKSGFEVDFILNGTTAIEIKGKKNVTRHDLKGLCALKEEEALENYIIVCLEDIPRRSEGIFILHMYFCENHKVANKGGVETDGKADICRMET